jgi:hypothetical protein
MARSQRPLVSVFMQVGHHLVATKEHKTFQRIDTILKGKIASEKEACQERIK